MNTTSVRRPSAIALLCGSLCALTSSCVTYTKYHDEPRAKVRFASTKAAQTFYDAYSSVGKPVGNGSLTVSLTPPMPYWQRTKDTESKQFNAAIKIADANQDATITEKEARTYATTINADGMRRMAGEDFSYPPLR